MTQCSLDELCSYSALLSGKQFVNVADDGRRRLTGVQLGKQMTCVVRGTCGLACHKTKQSAPTHTRASSSCVHAEYTQTHVKLHGRLHIRAKGVSWKNRWKIKKRKHAKKSSFLCLGYILRAIRAGRCRERRYTNDIFIQIYFRMHHFVVKFSSPQAARGHWPP